MLAVVVTMAAGLLEAALIVGDGLHDRPGRAEVALVLGNAVEADGRPSARLQARLDRAVEGYRHGDFPFVIASGGIEPGGQDEAAVMRGYLAAHGIPTANLIADNQGINTYASARFTSQIMHERGWKAVCVVTQYYHVSRARLALTRFGVHPVYSVHARYFEVYDAFAILREMAGYVKYSLRGYDVPAPPPARR